MPAWLQKLWVVIKPLFAGGGNKYDFTNAFPNAKNIVIVNSGTAGPVSVNQSGDCVTLDPSQFPRHGAEILPIIKEVLAESSGFVIEKSALSTIENIQVNEGDESVKEEIDYFRNILPLTCIKGRSSHIPLGM